MATQKHASDLKPGDLFRTFSDPGTPAENHFIRVAENDLLETSGSMLWVICAGNGQLMQLQKNALVYHVERCTEKQLIDPMGK